ncbi:MAG: mechanosensitive ion channel family protein [Treponema sp.]|jgi:small-conductance mechanosensitive channel|nr:mechanosensitive ion channel family protein [Treponema sp.]
MYFRYTLWAVIAAAIRLICFPPDLTAREDQGAGPGIYSPETPPSIYEDMPKIEKIETKLMNNWLNLNLLNVNIFIRLGIAGGIVIIQVLLICLAGFLFQKLQDKITLYGKKYLKALTIKNYRLLETQQILNAFYFILRILKYLVIAFQLYLTLPLIFSLFKPTVNLATTLFGYILNPLMDTGLAIINYIPNLITIVVIVLIAQYAIRSLKFFTEQIERKKLVVTGFYSDWARPTFNILRVFLYAFMVIVVYPYLPGSDSAVFQGVSVFVGIIFSLGSSSAIGNLVAGVVITYMRPFKIGDRIKINNIIGYVVEKSAIVTRLRTTKNEYVTFPNQTVLTSSIINYNFSSGEKEDGLILYADVTVGYGIPWRQVHELLTAAALKTAHVREIPKPFVLQTALDDYYCRYQINAYTKEIGKILAIYSELYQNIQDEFTAANIDLTSPHYEIHLPPPQAD